MPKPRKRKEKKRRKTYKSSLTSIHSPLLTFSSSSSPSPNPRFARQSSLFFPSFSKHRNNGRGGEEIGRLAGLESDFLRLASRKREERGKRGKNRCSCSCNFPKTEDIKMVHFHFRLFPQRGGAEGPKAQMFAWFQFKLFKSYRLGKGESCKLDRVRSNWVTRHPLFKPPDKRQWLLLLLLLYSHSAKKVPCPTQWVAEKEALQPHS